jgi:hypothetical protein
MSTRRPSAVGVEPLAQGRQLAVPVGEGFLRAGPPQQVALDARSPRKFQQRAGDLPAERIFEMHTRLHSYKEIPGSGIGLAACRRVAELHGGRIWLDASYAGGSRFVVWLPKQLGAAEANSASSPAA